MQREDEEAREGHGSAGGSDFDKDGYGAGSSFGEDVGTENHNDYDPPEPKGSAT